mmetsp:Transcript_15776/g.25028  ORF Transcript_15776/g.25028 Transcript_15776/m.25028 type:complete len:127 (+) Transcript_15776:35-415(+)
MAQYDENEGSSATPIAKKKYMFKVEAKQGAMHDVLVATNDMETLKPFLAWYTKVTTYKCIPQKWANKLVNQIWTLENARKGAGLGEHWDLIISEKLLEFGYKPAFATTLAGANDLAARASYLFYSE